MDRFLRSRVLLLLVTALLLASCARSPEAKKARYLERGDRFLNKAQYRESIIEYRNALRIDGNNTHAIRQLGLAHFQLGQMGQAFRFLLKAKELEPDNADILLKLGTVYLLGGRPLEAWAEADHVLRRNPENLDALALLAGASTTPQEVESAVRRLEAARPHLGKQPKFHLALGNLYLRKQDPVGAERAFRDALAQDSTSVEAHLALGTLYVARNNMLAAEGEFKAAADIAPVGSPARVRLADFYLLLGKPDEADRVLVEITQKAPDFLPAWRLIAELALARGLPDESAKAVEWVLKKNPSDLDARLLKGRIHLVKGQTNLAIQEFQAVLKTEPRLAAARYQIALAHLQGGNLQQAKAELKEAMTSAPNMVEPTLLLAELNIQTGVFQPAIDDLEKLLATQPRAARAYVLLSRAYLAQRQPAKAAEAARRFAEVAPKDARGPYLIGLSLLAQGRRGVAQQQFEASLAMAPAFTDPLAQLISLAFADKQSDAALERARKQAALLPASAIHQAMLGDVHFARRDMKLAEGAYLKALERDPRLMDPYLRLSTIYANSGAYDQALAKASEALKVNPRNAPALMVTGVIYEQKGETGKAREAYEQVLTIDPRFVPAANNLAWLYSEYGGDKEKALQLAQRAKELAPDDPRISDTLGWILYKRGVYQRALSLLKESAAKLPDNPQVQYHLGMAYAQVGDQASARQALERAVKSSSDFQGKDEARKTLASLR